MIFYRWGNWDLYSPPALLLTHDIPPKPTVCMGSPPKRGIHLVYALPPGYHISSLFLFTSCLLVYSRLVLSFWLSLAFLKHLLTSDKRQQILFLWPLCDDWRAFVVALSVTGYLGQTSSHAETKPGSFWISLHVQDLGCQPPQGLHKSRVNDRAASSKLVPRVTVLQHPVLAS